LTAAARAVQNPESAGLQASSAADAGSAETDDAETANSSLKEIKVVHE
jgi:hypothetical protein